jgi:hypothetical protein
VASVARVRIFGQVFHDPCLQRIGLDIPQDDQQVIAVLHDRASEPPLPNVAHGAMPRVKTPRVRYRQRLHNPADRLPRLWLNQQVDVIGHQAVQ